MNFEFYLMSCVFSKYFNEPIVYQSPVFLEIPFEMENCSLKGLTLISNFYWENNDCMHNRIEEKLMDYVANNSKNIKFSELGDIVIKDLRYLFGNNNYDYFVDKDSGCISVSFFISFFSIKMRYGKIQRLLGDFYNDINLSDEEMENFRKDYEDYFKKEKTEKNSQKEKLKNQNSVKNKRNQLISQLLKFSCPKNDKHKKYSYFLFAQIIDDYITPLITFHHNSFSYDFFVLIEDNKIKFSSFFRYGNSIDNPNEIESIFSSNQYFLEDKSYYSVYFDVKDILENFLTDYFIHAGNWDIFDNKAQLNISTSLSRIINSDSVLEKTLREKLSELNLTKEDYKRYDDLWEKKEEEIRIENEMLKNEWYDKHAAIREEEEDKRKKAENLLKELGLSDSTNAIRGDNIRW